MNNVCVIICFLVGVLIFSLIRSHCSCDVTEGYCCSLQRFNCVEGGWEVDEDGGYLLDHTSYPNSLIHDKYVSDENDLSGIYNGGLTDTIPNCDANTNGNLPCKKDNYINMGLSSQQITGVTTKGCSLNTGTGTGSPNVGSLPGSGLAFLHLPKIDTDIECKNECDIRSDVAEYNGWECLAYSFDIVDAKNKNCNIYGSWTSTVLDDYSRRYLYKDPDADGFVQIANPVPKIGPDQNFDIQTCEQKLRRQPSLNVSDYDNTTSVGGCFIKNRP